MRIKSKGNYPKRDIFNRKRLAIKEYFFAFLVNRIAGKDFPRIQDKVRKAI
jgi:hypothetical protein